VNAEIDKFKPSERFDLRVHIASFAGYGLHANCMLTLSEFRDLCKWFLETKTPVILKDELPQV
jgi:hypothetical protein